MSSQGTISYAASKSAVLGLTRAAAREPDGHRGVEVRAAVRGHAEDGDEDRHAPSPGDHDPSCTLSLRALENDVGDDAVTETFCLSYDGIQVLRRLRPEWQS